VLTSMLYVLLNNPVNGYYLPTMQLEFIKVSVKD